MFQSGGFAFQYKQGFHTQQQQTGSTEEEVPENSISVYE
jgi:hypothetical protein